jgi:hypothetical protein
VVNLVLVWLIAMVALVSISFSLSMPYRPFFGDGLIQGNYTASLGDRKADLLIRIIPQVVTTETEMSQTEKLITEFRLFDLNTNKSFTHVTYFITIEKGDKIRTLWNLL